MNGGTNTKSHHLAGSASASDKGGSDLEMLPAIKAGKARSSVWLLQKYRASGVAAKVKRDGKLKDTPLRMENVSLILHRDFAAQHNQPMSYPEWGCGDAGDDPYFIEQMAKWFSENPVVYQTY
jgi:hypothetical protein